jgi:hypothetical protein
VGTLRNHLGGGVRGGANITGALGGGYRGGGGGALGERRMGAGHARSRGARVGKEGDGVDGGLGAWGRKVMPQMANCVDGGRGAWGRAVIARWGRAVTGEEVSAEGVG